MGHFFDAVSSICNIRRKVNYEGQAAIEIEMKIEKIKSKVYNYQIKKEGQIYIIHPENIIEEIVYDLKKKKNAGLIAYRFHITISDIIRKVAIILRDERKINKVALSGGVFQNNFLLENVYNKLKKDGFDVSIHRKSSTK